MTDVRFFLALLLSAIATGSMAYVVFTLLNVISDALDKR